MIGKALLFAAKVLLGLFLLLFGLALFGPIIVPLVTFLFIMLVGWINFLSRVLPEVSLNPYAISFAIICSGLLIWGAQWFCGWLYGQYRSRMAADSTWPPAWPWRWTVGSYCGLWLLFLASMSVTGVTHQVGWLVRSDKPILVSSFPRERVHLINAASHISAGCRQAQWESRGVRAACKESLERRAASQDESWAERWNLVVIEARPGAVQAVFFAYRDPDLAHKYGYRRVTPDGIADGPFERMAEDIRAISVKVATSAN